MAKSCRMIIAFADGHGIAYPKPTNRSANTLEAILTADS
jgi:hypothetical protein